jgi:hypothetical protein
MPQKVGTKGRTVRTLLALLAKNLGYKELQVDSNLTKIYFRSIFTFNNKWAVLDSPTKNQSNLIAYKRGGKKSKHAGIWSARASNSNKNQTQNLRKCAWTPPIK